MNPRRRHWLLHLTAWPWVASAAKEVAPPAEVSRGRKLEFPRDHGAHLAARTEWWYVTGWLGPLAQPTHGFQVTFFRSRTGLAQDTPGRFAARQLLFAHAAVTALAERRHVHDQRLARWNGEPGAVQGSASTEGGEVRMGRWSLRDDGDAWKAGLQARDFSLELSLQRTQPLLLQGDAGFSRKGPDERQASHYYSEPQLAAGGRIAVLGRAASAQGRAWLDHEWSDEILHPQAVGWDWIGMNLADGSALTAFVLRRRDGSALWAGGSFRPAGGPAPSTLSFAPGAVQFTAGRRWRSPGSGATYPVQWQLQTPAGRFEVRALLDAQELDSSASTGTVYWEGLSELLDTQGRRVGLGYLEMTGYTAPLRLR
ncbi:MAG: carotenoid 1,2-hydratase [Rubrivivax sp.]|nr:carotenoid 1,2-hydratase [Rubrivivax sp.]